MNDQKRANIDNDNDILHKQNNNVNDIDNDANEINVLPNVDNATGDDKYARSKLIDMTAYKLCDVFDNPNGFKFYCKVAWCLQPSVIWSNVEVAKRGRNPAKLFTYLCKKCLGK